MIQIRSLDDSVIQIRTAGPEDADCIASVLRRAFTEFLQLYTTKAFEETTPTAVQIRNRFAAGPVWVAVHGSMIVGTVSGLPMEDSFYIRSMAVSPTARKFGIARRLLQALEAYAIQNGFTILSLCTTPFLVDAIHLYEKNGFHFVRDGMSDLFGTPLLKMIKRID